jgi:hypothetical protein
MPLHTAAGRRCHYFGSLASCQIVQFHAANGMNGQKPDVRAGFGRSRFAACPGPALQANRAGSQPKKCRKGIAKDANCVVYCESLTVGR